MDYTQLIESDAVVMIEFYATWCPHCQRMMPIVKQIKDLLVGRAAIHQLDIDKNQEEAEQEKVETIPTFIIYKDGHEMWRKSGEINAEVLLNKIESYL